MFKRFRPTFITIAVEIITVTLLIFALPIAARAADASRHPKLALIIANAASESSGPKTALNDGALLGRILKDNGFDVMGARNATGAALNSAIDEFLTKASTQTPAPFLFVYFAGQTTAIGGENILLGYDASPGTENLNTKNSVALTTLMMRLAKTTAVNRLVIVDSFPLQDPAKKRYGASVTAWTDPTRETLIGLNPAPGMNRADPQSQFGPYALALAEAISSGDGDLDHLFQSVTIRAADLSNATTLPWFASRITTASPFPIRPESKKPTHDIVNTQMRDFDAASAFYVALARNDLGAFEEFQFVFDREKSAKRMEVLHAVRREAMIWHEATQIDNAEAYWTYLGLYPIGVFAQDARAKLIANGQPVDAPPQAAKLIFSAGRPSPEELKKLDQRTSVTSVDASQIYGSAPRPNGDLIALTPLNERNITVSPSDIPYGLPLIGFASDTAPPKQIAVPTSLPKSEEATQPESVKTTTQSPIANKPVLAKKPISKAAKIAPSTIAAPPSSPAMNAPQLPVSTDSSLQQASPPAVQLFVSTPKRVPPSFTPFGAEGGDQKVPFIE